MAHNFRTTHAQPADWAGPNAIPGSYPSAAAQQTTYQTIQPTYPPSGRRPSDMSDWAHKHVRFAEDTSPSSITLKMVLGPKENPTCIVKLSIAFEKGMLPRIKVKTTRPKPKSRGRRHAR